MKILFLGDVVGKPGRKAVIKLLPSIKKTYKPDFIFCNAENLSHGNGVSEKTIKEMMDAGVDAFTSGNHIWDNRAEIEKIFAENKLPVLRPANYPEGTAGIGHRIFEVGKKKLLLVNLMGRVFIRENFDCPFRKLEKISEEYKDADLSAIVVDFHAEATSEKIVFARYFDGKVSAVFGTHTHVPTADAQIFPGGTGYITDAGMCGIKEGSLGIAITPLVKNFLYQIPVIHEIPDKGICVVDGIFAIIKPETKLTTKIKPVLMETEI